MFQIDFCSCGMFKRWTNKRNEKEELCFSSKWPNDILWSGWIFFSFWSNKISENETERKQNTKWKQQNLISFPSFIMVWSCVCWFARDAWFLCVCVSLISFQPKLYAIILIRPRPKASSPHIYYIPQNATIYNTQNTNSFSAELSSAENSNVSVGSSFSLRCCVCVSHTLHTFFLLLSTLIIDLVPEKFKKHEKV